MVIKVGTSKDEVKLHKLTVFSEVQGEKTNVSNSEV